MIYSALISSLLSIFLHLYLTLQHFQLKLGLADGKSACNISSTFNCDSVAISSFSMFAGFPVAIWGMATNAILFIMIAVAFLNLTQNSLRWLRFSFYLSLLVALTSVIMFFISSFILKTYCLYCMGAYLLSFLTAGALFKLIDQPFANLAEDIKSVFGEGRMILASLIAIPVSTFLIHAIFSKNYGLDKLNLIVVESVDHWQNTNPQNFDLQKGLIYQKGNQNPVMTIVEFADYKCPHCKAAGPTLHAFTESRPDVRLVFKPFPLDGTCNPAIAQKGDGSRCTLAYYVFCSEKLAQKGWAMNNWIFENQESFISMGSPDSLLEKAALDLNISITDLKTCAQSTEVQDLIFSMANEGKTAQIRGTPTIFVDGKTLERGHFLPVLEAAYNKIKAQ
jgi:protein-disulfide isomerase/uncharacterized membrane protein